MICDVRKGQSSAEEGQVELDYDGNVNPGSDDNNDDCKQSPSQDMSQNEII